MHQEINELSDHLDLINAVAADTNLSLPQDLL